jgi:conjugal transfer pilus assembly protein TraK
MKNDISRKPFQSLLLLILLILTTGSADLSFGEDLKAPDEKESTILAPAMNLPSEGAVIVMPEIAQSVELSSSDVNRITCQGEIKDVIFSKEKGITVKFSGKDAFVKFHMIRKEGQTAYSAIPSELFIACGENIYNIIAIPRRIPARSVRLSSGRMENIRKNKTLLGALPFERKMLNIVRSLYQEEIPDSYTMTNLNRRVEMFRDLDLVLTRIAVIDGEGVQAKEYRVVIAAGGREKIELSEKDFLRNEISPKPLAISLDRLVLKKGEILRIFVIERAQEEPDSER